MRDSDVGAAILLVADHAEPGLVVSALDAGADDCVTRPVRLGEITARVRAVVRRGGSPRHVELRVGSLHLDPAAHRVWRGNEEIDTTATEFALLAELMRHSGQVLSRAELLDLVWGREESETSNVVDQAVARLRRLVDEPFDLATLETVRGVGYRLVDDDTTGTPSSKGTGGGDT
ncbi:response regulator transcription factor [Mobilicoccus pelagius]|uniref:Putative two-component response regulator n=1 Tax=Mobilicoccus pelagius NBRC 104925 TaxID=1089455 RepID=H5UME1_9MICO|nr:response regulator transcription factor [Mobilicoccus pelagius]GAB46899.1 putative two-component response regulator [Mobilicoccus pelagius NBRC 104925]